MLTRRTSLMAGVAGAAALAGVGAWWWQAGQQPQPIDAAFWQLKLPRPDGGELDMASLRGRPLIINFWATWCAPCIKELPDLDAFACAHRAQGWRVVGLAVDKPEPVAQFLRRTPLSIEIGIAGFDGTELAQQLGNPRAVLPFTLMVDAQGRVRQRKLGATTLAELQSWAAAL